MLATRLRTTERRFAIRDSDRSGRPGFPLGGTDASPESFQGRPNALKKGMEEKSGEFIEKGAEVYAKA